LPALDLNRPHVLAAEMRFADGAVARREVVFGGQFAETAQAQLTPMLVVRTGAGDAAPAVGCFAANGAPLPVRSIETPAALVTVVREPVTEGVGALFHRGTPMSRQLDRTDVKLDEGTWAQILFPVASRVAANETATSLFPTSPYYNAAKHGVYYLVTASQTVDNATATRRWADAVAVAGVSAAASRRRRAVVLVLTERPDGSAYQPANVRQYLDALGVPLFVWSPTGPRPDLAATWGEVEDISTIARLREAAERLRLALARQRIAWIAADPLAALRAEVKEGCGYARPAR